MAHYFVGDIQGCFDELQLLLAKVDFSPSRDQLWAVGDLVARGPGSLATLRFLQQLEGAAFPVLGNHDLHLFAVHAGLRSPHPKDKLNELLDAPDIDALINWLRTLPLYRELPEHKVLMTHAGVPPQWDLATLKVQADAVSDALKSPDYIGELISKMYGSNANVWHGDASELERKVYCINALTRMRFLYGDNRLDFDCKLPPVDCRDPDLTPWFERTGIIEQTHTLVFGHWAAIMGQTAKANFHALDTGCCWGEYLTLWHLEANQKITQKKV